MTNSVDPEIKPPSVGLELCALLHQHEPPDLDEIRALAASGAELDNVPLEQGGSNYYSYTPLQICVMQHHTDAMRLLLELGADPNAKNFLGITALHEAAKKGHEDMVKLLLAAGADAAIQTGVSFVVTPFDLAACNGHTHLLPLLRVPGVDLNAVRGNGRTLLQDALKQANTWTPNAAGDAVQWLLDQGADPNQKGGYVSPPLIEVLGYKDWKHAQMLVKAGADVHARCALGTPAINVAAWEEGGLEIIKLLVEYGADLEAREARSSDTPMTIAAACGVLDTVQWLGQMGVNLESRGKREITALNLARDDYVFYKAEAGKPPDSRVIKQLLDFGARIDDERILSLPFVKERHDKATTRWQQVQSAIPHDVTAISAHDLVLFANMGWPKPCWPGQSGTRIVMCCGS